MGFKETFRSLGNRNYRLYFIGQSVSVTGTWMQRVSQAWLVLELTDSGTLLGVAAALQHLPFLLIGAWGGLLADRVDKRRLLLFTQALAGLLALILGLLVATGRVQLWMVLLLALALGGVNAIDHPARHSFVPEMVSRDHVTNAVTLNSIVVNAGRTIGPALAGGLIATFGLSAAFLLNAASYLAVFVALAVIRAHELDRVVPAERGRGQLREGIRHVRQTPQLAVPLFLLTVSGLLAFEFQVKLPLLARYVFNGDADTFGWMFSIMGLGAVLGGLVVAALLRPTTTVLLVASALLGATIVGTAVAPTLATAFIGLFAVGATTIAFRSGTSSILQLQADPTMRGRVMAMSGIAMRGTTVVAAPLAGWVADTAGPRAALGIGGVATILAAIAAAWYLDRHHSPLGDTTGPTQVETIRPAESRRKTTMTTRLQLSMSLGDYDINRPIIDGEVRPAGIDVIPLVQSSPQRHWRMLLHRDFDVCEMSMGSYVAMVSRGDDSLAAIPVFPHRRFRHSYVFVTAARDIQTAEDLKGGRVGIRSWQVTGGIWMRGLLADYYGLPLDAVTWVAQDPDDIELNLAPGLRLERVTEGQAVTDLCARGELDGLLYPEIPEQVHAQTGQIRRLFEDPRATEEAYFRDTGIFPIMHVVVMRRDIVDRHPWVARSLLEAFTESKRRALHRMRDPRVVSLAWLRWLIEHEREVLGADPWAYGLGEANRHTLDTFLRYTTEQGVAVNRLQVDDLFLDNVLDDPPKFV